MRDDTMRDDTMRDDTMRDDTMRDDMQTVGLGRLTGYYTYLQTTIE